MRFSVTSFFYLILLLINPLLKAPNDVTMSGKKSFWVRKTLDYSVTTGNIYEMSLSDHIQLLVCCTGHTGWYLKAFALLGIFNFLMTLIFQIVLLSIPPYGFFLQPCK